MKNDINILKRLLLLLLTSMFWSITYSQCNIDFQDINLNVDWRSGVGYDPSSVTTHQHREDINIINNGTSSCSSGYFITISNGSNNDPAYIRRAFFDANVLDYQIYSQNIPSTTAIVKQIPDLSNQSNVLLESSLNIGQSKTSRYWISIPALQNISDGVYTDSFTIKLYRGSWTNTPAPSDLMVTSVIQLFINVQNSTLGIENNIITLQNIYPNPVKNTLFIKGIVNQENYTIYSLLGEKILKGTLNRDNSSVNVSKLTKGVYFLKLENSKSIKILKK